MDSKPQSPAVSLPAAIVIAGALIAVAIIWTNKSETVTKNADSESTEQSETAEATVGKLPPITDKDHILGNPEATIKVVEYSDPSCPFCKMFNQTMVDIMAEYGPAGKVAWVYRSFPLDKPNANGQVLHPDAGKQAEAFECAAELGGNKSFWDYEKLFYSRIDTAQGFDNAKLPDLGAEIGLDKVKFKECLDGGKMKARVDAQYESGIEAGVHTKGTPYSIILGPGDRETPILGAQPASSLKKIIDVLLE